MRVRQICGMSEIERMLQSSTKSSIYFPYATASGQCSHAEEEGLSTAPRPARPPPSSDAASPTPLSAVSPRRDPTRCERPPAAPPRPPCAACLAAHRLASHPKRPREREATRREGGSRLMCGMRQWQRTATVALGRRVSASTVGWWRPWGDAVLCGKQGVAIG
jgi:hypothetical protein